MRKIAVFLMFSCLMLHRMTSVEEKGLCAFVHMSQVANPFTGLLLAFSESLSLSLVAMSHLHMSSYFPHLWQTVWQETGCGLLQCMYGFGAIKPKPCRGSKNVTTHTN